jgi:hypothetical protein
MGWEHPLLQKLQKSPISPPLEENCTPNQSDTSTFGPQDPPIHLDTQNPQIEDSCDAWHTVGSHKGARVTTLQTTPNIFIPNRALKQAHAYKEGKIYRCANSGNFQLVLKIPAQLPNGATHFLKILIDTGAEANLVRKNLLPSHLFYPSRNPLRLLAANGLLMQGGSFEIDLDLTFTQHFQDYPGVADFCTHASFYEADIGVDAILSFPWLSSRKLGIFPHRRALALEGPPLSFLKGARKPKKISQRDTSVAPIDTTPSRYPNSRRRRKKLRTISAQDLQLAQDSCHDPPLNKWKTEKYAVLPSLVQEILNDFQVEVTLDAFADQKNSRHPRHWGKGGEVEDAFSQNWSEHGLLWCNPPFSLLSQVVDKVRRDRAKIILICPDWNNQKYFWDLQDMVLKRKFFPVGTPVFELNGRACDPPKWGTWAFLLDGSKEPPSLRILMIVRRRKFFLNYVNGTSTSPKRDSTGKKIF